jgi:putative ABC transport system ATP-binding protein
VFQGFNLLPSLTVEQNVTLPLRLAGRRADRRLVAEVLGRVGLTERRRQRPAELSGGQQQRVALARGLITRPEVLFADEPTGALDLRTSREVLGLFRELVDTLGQTVVMVTHDPVAASYADSVLFLADGRIVDQLDRPTAEAVAERMTALTGADEVAWRCCIWSVCGMVKSRHSLASDRQGQLVERGRQAPSHWLVDRELVVASS